MGKDKTLYDATKDKVIKEIGTFETPGGLVTVRIRQYGTGPLKVAVTKAFQVDGETRETGKVGRFSRDEIDLLITYLGDAAKAIDEMRETQEEPPF